ncbi:MAG: hypothetical protein WA057_01035, partial [Candidatus Magasanikiibacteriota bacterium]
MKFIKILKDDLEFIFDYFASHYLFLFSFFCLAFVLTVFIPVWSPLVNVKALVVFFIIYNVFVLLSKKGKKFLSEIFLVYKKKRLNLSFFPQLSLRLKDIIKFILFTLILVVYLFFFHNLFSFIFFFLGCWAVLYYLESRVLAGLAILCLL